MLGLLKKKKGYCKDLENCFRVRETFCFRITLIYLVEDRRLNSTTVSFVSQAFDILLCLKNRTMGLSEVSFSVFLIYIIILLYYNL